MSRKASLTDIRSFVTAQRWGVLATASQSHSGYPFGSLVPYDIDSRGSIVIYVSLIAEHYKNLKADGRASLLALDSFGISDPQAHARATLLLDFQVVPEAEREAAQKSYETRFPNSINYEIAHNFLFMRGTTRGVRWIGGFGDIQWVSGDNFSSAVPDILAYAAWDVISHMNQDHADALSDLVKSKVPGQGQIHDPKMVALDHSGFKIQYGKEPRREVHIPFVPEITDATSVRTSMIETLRQARAAQGQPS